MSDEPQAVQRRRCMRGERTKAGSFRGRGGIPELFHTKGTKRTKRVVNVECVASGVSPDATTVGHELRELKLEWKRGVTWPL